MQKKVLTCPQCGSAGLYYEAGLVTGYKYHCKDCDYVGAFVIERDIPDGEKSNMPSGRLGAVKSGFIALEGIDGCGKSSLTSVIASRLMEAGFKVELTTEPTRTWLGDAVRRSYTEEVSPYTEAFLFLADRATHTEWIRKRMQAGCLVISDRYSDSTVAYQAALLHQKLGGNTAEYIEYLTTVSKPAIQRPDLTLLLDVDPEISLKRLGGRSELEKFENLDNLRLVRQNYLDIARESGHVKVIDASRGIIEVRESIFSVLGSHFGIKL